MLQGPIVMLSPLVRPRCYIYFLFPNPDQNRVSKYTYVHQIAWNVHAHKSKNTAKQMRTRIFISSDSVREICSVSNLDSKT